jgi:hypothetical protein
MPAADRDQRRHFGPLPARQLAVHVEREPGMHRDAPRADVRAGSKGKRTVVFRGGPRRTLGDTYLADAGELSRNHAAFAPSQSKGRTPVGAASFSRSPPTASTSSPSPICGSAFRLLIPHPPQLLRLPHEVTLAVDQLATRVVVRVLRLAQAVTDLLGSPKPRSCLLPAHGCACASTYNGRSRYAVPVNVQAMFGGPMLTWKELADHFGDDAMLLRADAVYEPTAFAAYGRNNDDGHMTGDALMACHERGEDFWVGRGGGLAGPRLAKDIATGRWTTQPYETNRDASEAPSRNWFRLSELARRVRG